MLRWLVRVVLVAALVLLLTDSSIAQWEVIAPPEYQMRENAARREMLEGDWLESLRQSCKVLELLRSEKIRRQLGKRHSMVKAQFHMLKAEVLAEIGCKKQALVNYSTARDVLENQGNVGFNSPDAKARLDFIAASIHKPPFEGDGEDGNAQRWRQALDRCGQELERLGDAAPPRLKGKQLVEMARAMMYDRSGAEPAEHRYADAGNYLIEAGVALSKHPEWMYVCDPKDPVKFVTIDERVRLKLIQSEDADKHKETIRDILVDWVNWKMARAELAVKQRDTNRLSGPAAEDEGGDKAHIEFDEICNYLSTQYGGDDHPVVWRTRLSRASWFLGVANRDCSEGLVPKKLGDQEWEQRFARVQSYLGDAMDLAADISKEMSKLTPTIETMCLDVERRAIRKLLQLDKDVHGFLSVPEHSELELRADEIDEQFSTGVLEAKADKLVNHLGCPSTVVE